MFVKPTFVIENIIDLDPLWLQTKGIQGLILDLDNTIMAPRAGILEPPMEVWLSTVKDHGLRCVVVSNNKRQDYLNKVEKRLAFPVLGNAGKPSIKSLQYALTILELTALEVAIVGDRPLTDILGGQRLGAHTILVDPLTKHLESPAIKFLRKLERLLVKMDHAILLS